MQETQTDFINRITDTFHKIWILLEKMPDGEDKNRIKESIKKKLLGLISDAAASGLKTEDMTQSMMKRLEEVESEVRIFELVKSMADRTVYEEIRRIRDQINKIYDGKRDESSDEWMNILHISDLHFGLYQYSKTPKQSKTEFDKIVQTKLFSFLKEYTNCEGRRIHIIAITGDLSYRNNKEGYEDFQNWLEKLCSGDILNLDISQAVFICAGNHDSKFVNRSQHGLLTSEDAKRRKKEKMSVDYVLSKDHISKRQNKQFKRFNNVCSNLGIHGLKNIELPASQTPVKYLFGRREYNNIEFVILNSAWNSFPNISSDGKSNEYNHGNLFLGQKLVEEILPNEGKKDITITMFHHPLSWLHESEVRTYGNDQAKPVVSLVRSISDIILNGHVHGKIEPPDVLADKTLVFTGGTLNSNDSAAYQFEILSLNLTMHYCIQRVVTYNRQNDGGEGGCWEVEREDNQKRYYYGKYRMLRDYLARIALGEASINEVMRSLKDDAKEAFLDLYKQSKFGKVSEFIEQYVQQLQKEGMQYNNTESMLKKHNKEQIDE